jgi:hypothetical protein
MVSNHDKAHRTEEPFEVRPPARRCWICRRSPVSGTTILGPNSPNGGTVIPLCAKGSGCQDGRIKHGPPHMVEPHWPGEACTVCDEERQRATARANQARSAWHPQSGRGNSRR